MMKRAWIVGLFILFIGPSVTAAEPTLRHWRREIGQPVMVTVYDQTRDKLWEDATQKLTNEWNAGIKDVKFVYNHNPTNSDCGTGRGENTIVVCVQENSNPDHVAEAHLAYNGEHLHHVMIWMDPTRPNPAKNHLACHELGHALGLIHRDPNEMNTCMIDGYTRKVEHPDQVDFNNVNFSHSHIH